MTYRTDPPYSQTDLSMSSELDIPACQSPGAHGNATERAKDAMVELHRTLISESCPFACRLEMTNPLDQSCEFSAPSALYLLLWSPCAEELFERQDREVEIAVIQLDLGNALWRDVHLIVLKGDKISFSRMRDCAFES